MISAIELRNFKCFKSEIIEFSPLTLLTGLNGTGKSTIIQSLLLLRQSFYENVLAKGITLNGDLINIGTGRDLLYERTEEPEEIFIGIEIDKTLISNWIFGYKNDSNFLHSNKSEISYPLENINIFNDRFEYLCAERIGPRTTFQKSNFIVAEHKHLGIHGEFAEHYLHIYGTQPIINLKAKHDEVNELNLVNQVQGWLNIISPGVRIETSEYSQADLIGMQYKFIDKEISNSYRPPNVGFGITYTLPVIIALLKAVEGDIVIIENPEAHLHPKGQRELGELIAKTVSGGVQVIVETHSDHILNGIRLAVRNKVLSPLDVKLNYVERVEKNEQFIHQIVSPNIKEDGRLDFWPKGFFDEWDEALNELF